MPLLSASARERVRALPCEAIHAEILRAFEAIRQEDQAGENGEIAAYRGLQVP